MFQLKRLSGNTFLHRKLVPVVTHCTMATSSCIHSCPLKYLDRPGGNQVSYKKTDGTKSPGIMFLPGFMSNMNGGKALALESFCKQHGHSYVRFDYQGCGESRGNLARGSRAFDTWKTDAQAVLDQLTTGPQILVGSSMGGAIMLLLAVENPSRIQALLGVATAVVFDKPLTYTEDAQKEGQIDATSTKTDYVTPKDFLDKRYQRCLMSDSIPVTQPVCLIHGMSDDTVPYRTSVDLATRLQSQNVDVVLRKTGKHRMSEPEDLRLLIQCLVRLIDLKLDSNL